MILQVRRPTPVCPPRKATREKRREEGKRTIFVRRIRFDKRSFPTNVKRNSGIETNPQFQAQTFRMRTREVTAEAKARSRELCCRSPK